MANTARGTVEPFLMSDLPRGPWLNYSVDFCRPFTSGDYLLVKVDESGSILISRNSDSRSLLSTFSLFGFPEVVKSDNGPPFNGTNWVEYMEECCEKCGKFNLKSV